MQTALLIIDVQQSLVDEGIWEANRVIKEINKLIEKAEKYKVPIILIRDTRVKPNSTFHYELNIDINYIEIIKSFCDSFMNTQLDELLKSKRIDKLIIGGFQSDFCVDTTCRQAATRGYDVDLVSNAHSTLNHEHLKAKQIINHHNRILRNFDTVNGKVRVVESGKLSF